MSYVVSENTKNKILELIRENSTAEDVPSRGSGRQVAVVRVDSRIGSTDLYNGTVRVVLADTLNLQSLGPCYVINANDGLLETERNYIGVRYGLRTQGDATKPLFVVEGSGMEESSSDGPPSGICLPFLTDVAVSCVDGMIQVDKTYSFLFIPDGLGISVHSDPEDCPGDMAEELFNPPQGPTSSAAMVPMDDGGDWLRI